MKRRSFRWWNKLPYKPLLFARAAMAMAREESVDESDGTSEM